MANVVIQGIKMSITDTMQEQAQKAMDKVFSRYHPISHRISVRQSPDGFELKLHYQDEVDQYEASHTGRDFYAGIKVLRDTILRNIKRAHQAKISQKRQATNPDKQQALRESVDAGVDVDLDEADAI